MNEKITDLKNTFSRLLQDQKAQLKNEITTIKKHFDVLYKSMDERFEENLRAQAQVHDEVTNYERLIERGFRSEALHEI